MKLIFELSKPGMVGTELPELDVPERKCIPDELKRKELKLPEVSEIEIIRHYTALSRRNFGVDNGFYPLGSCTMKYNPKINEDMASLPGFTHIHPYDEDAQGCLQLMYGLQKDLAEITGMDAVTLQPVAGAHGELTGLMIVKAYFKDRNEKRKIILTPDSSHGTNPASATMAGFEMVQIRSNYEGCVDLEDLKQHMTKDVAALMLTNPNTLGIFDKNIMEIAKIVHDKGGLVYCDGANTNAILGIAKPADMGFDIIHLNLHKSFSTPHGGGGPGSGPVGVTEELIDFLPRPIVVKDEEGNYSLDYSGDKSIGQVRAFYGNFGVLVKAYTYIKGIGASGLRAVGENSVLNANYMKEKLRSHYHLPYDHVCQHEFVLNDEGMPNGITTNDISKRLLDYGFHAPTIYFPLIVHGAIMIEPTETETKETMDMFIETMIKIKQEAEENPEVLKTAPQTTVVGKLDGVKAARELNLKWEGYF